MATLVTINEGLAHLRLSDPGSPEDSDLQAKLEAAEAIVLNYIERTDDPDWSDEIASWDDTTVPKTIKAAILMEFGELYRLRGDDEPPDQPKRDHGFLSPIVTSLLHRYRDPALA